MQGEKVKMDNEWNKRTDNSEQESSSHFKRLTVLDCITNFNETKSVVNNRRKHKSITTRENNWHIMQDVTNVTLSIPGTCLTNFMIETFPLDR